MSPATAAHIEECRHARFHEFELWQKATIMCLIFGDNYVTIPPLPPGYEVYGKWWYDNQLKAVR